LGNLILSNMRNTEATVTGGVLFTDQCQSGNKRE